MWRQDLYLPQLLFHFYFFKMESLTVSGTHQLAGLARSASPGVLLSLPAQCWDCNYIPSGLFTWVQMIWTQELRPVLDVLYYQMGHFAFIFLLSVSHACATEDISLNGCCLLLFAMVWSGMRTGGFLVYLLVSDFVGLCSRDRTPRDHSFVPGPGNFSFCSVHSSPMTNLCLPSSQSNWWILLMSDLLYMRVPPGLAVFCFSHCTGFLFPSQWHTVLFSFTVVADNLPWIFPGPFPRYWHPLYQRNFFFCSPQGWWLLLHIWDAERLCLFGSHGELRQGQSTNSLGSLTLSWAVNGDPGFIGPFPSSSASCKWCSPKEPLRGWRYHLCMALWGGLNCQLA